LSQVLDGKVELGHDALDLGDRRGHFILRNAFGLGLERGDLFLECGEFGHEL
jgi:hypothetical protein